MNYSYDILYKPTTEIGNADGLSRLPVGPDLHFEKLIEDEVNYVDVLYMFVLQASTSRSRLTRLLRRPPKTHSSHVYTAILWKDGLHK